MQLERMLSPYKVAKWLGISGDTIYRLIRSGELRARKTGRRYMIEEDAVLEFLESAELDDSRRLYQRSLALGRLYVHKASEDGLEAYFDLAEAKFRRAAAIRPGDTVARYELVRTLVLHGKDAAAKKAFSELEAAQRAARQGRKRELKAAV